MGVLVMNKKMKLRDWFDYVMPLHEILYQSSVDDVDMRTKGVPSDTFVPEPIGISRSCMLRHLYDLSFKTYKPPAHTKLLLCAFNVNTDKRRRGGKAKNRKKIAFTLEENGFKNDLVGDRYWNSLSHHKFVASPEGNGIQTHRTYEALYWKSIPIVEDTPCSVEQLKGLPILFTHDYSEITVDYLEKKYEDMLDQEYDFRVLFLSTYSDEIQKLILRRSFYWCRKLHKFNWSICLNTVKGYAKIFEDVSFVTLTNSGYKGLTLNCLKSLERMNMQGILSHGIRLKVFCLDDGAYTFFSEKHKHVYSFTGNSLQSTIDFSQSVIYKNPLWSVMTIQKLFLIYTELSKNNFVLFTDGDIVFQNEWFFVDLYKRMVSNSDVDIFAQHEYTLSKPNSTTICSGFMMIRKNEKTLRFFHPDTITQREIQNDQDYMNRYKGQLNVQLLPDCYYPNGCFFFKKRPKGPFMVHYNFLQGVNTKQCRMSHYNMWFV